MTCGVIHSTTFLETTSIRGWIVDAQEPTAALQRLQVVLPTGTAHAVTRVWRQAGPGGEAGPWLFQALIHPSIAADSKAWRLEAWFAGSTGPASVAYPGECRRDFPLTIVDAFIEQACRSPGTILDIGSRARSGINRRTMFAGLEYVGLDVLPGPNVDVVGDAHALDEHFGPESFDYIYSQYTFEHLLMPWKVALAMNVVLKPGGLALIGTHQTVGHHDMPWDYWRYSQDAWKALFNQHTGFEVVRTEYTEPVFIVPFYNSDWHDGFEGAAGFYGSYAIVRKIGPAQERWVGSPKTVVRDAYPE